MKKILIVLGIGVFSLGAVSCKKECVCKWSGENVPDEMKAEIKVGELSKSECEDKTPSVEMPGLTYKCESK